MEKAWLYQVRYWWTDQAGDGPDPTEGAFWGAEYYGTELEANIARDELIRKCQGSVDSDPSSIGKFRVEVRHFELVEVLSTVDV